VLDRGPKEGYGTDANGPPPHPPHQNKPQTPNAFCGWDNFQSKRLACHMTEKEGYKGTCQKEGIRKKRKKAGKGVTNTITRHK